VTAALAPEGLLDLRFAAGPDGRTELARRAQRFPLRLTVPIYLDPADSGMAFVYVQNPTGAVLGGDDLLLRVVAGPATRVHVTTPSATRIHRMESGEARQRVELELGEGAYVEHVPEQLVPQAGSRYEQRTSVSLSHGAAFVGVEILAPGRYARGEIFDYDRLLLATDVRGPDGRELCVDTVLFEPSRRGPARRGLLGARPYVATVLAVAPRADAEALARAMDAAARSATDTVGAAGTLPTEAGAIARVLASSGAAARHAADAAWEAARLELRGLPLPPRRK
jgi:urease accessory protein